MSAKTSAKTKPAGARALSWLGWLLFLLTLPVLFSLAAKGTKASTIIERDECIATLKRIDDAKEEWALKNKKRSGETPDAGDLKEYLKTSLGDLHCPAHGEYKINAIGTNPQCTVAGHELH